MNPKLMNKQVLISGDEFCKVAAKAVSVEVDRCLENDDDAKGALLVTLIGTRVLAVTAELLFGDNDDSATDSQDQ